MKAVSVFPQGKIKKREAGENGFLFRKFKGIEDPKGGIEDPKGGIHSRRTYKKLATQKARFIYRVNQQ